MVDVGSQPTAAPPSGGPPLPYCEHCGNLIGAVSTLLHVDLRICASCGVYACDRCWFATPGRCPACGVRDAAAEAVRAARMPIAVVTGALPVPPSVPSVAEPSTEAAPAPSRAGPDRRTRVDLGIALTALVVLAFVAVVPFPSRGGVQGTVATAPAIAAATPTLPEAGPVASPEAESGIPSAPATPRPTPASTSDPTPRPTLEQTLPTPPAVLVAGTWFRGWADPSKVTRGQVIAIVENRSSGWVMFPTGASRYTIQDESGAWSASGAFAHAFPQRVPPGGRAYLVDMIDASFADLPSLRTVSVDPVVEAGAPAPAGLVVTDVSWADADDGSLIASGLVINRGSVEIRDVLVGVAFLDAAGRPLAVIYDPEPQTLRPHASYAFGTGYPETGPLDPAEVASIDPIAGPYQP